MTLVWPKSKVKAKPVGHPYDYKMGRYGGFWQCLRCNVRITTQDCPYNGMLVEAGELQPFEVHLADLP